MTEEISSMNSVMETAASLTDVDHQEAEVPGGGLEDEREDVSQIKRPFDPEKIKVRTTPILVDLLISRIRHGEIDLAPDFQRLAGIWDNTRKSRLIESLLLRIPIPVFYVAADEKEIWSVVDGVQRISTIYDYVRDKFRLSQLEYLQKLEGAFYSSLPRQMQRRIDETQFVVNVIEPGTPEEVMFNIFRRINTGGKPLNGQEIRHALHAGPVREYLKKLAETDEFLMATNYSISKKRMGDRECVLRFLAFHIDPWEEYRAGDLDTHLRNAMKTINSMDSNRRTQLEQDFRKAMRAAFDVFGDEAFRKLYARGERKKPVNRALFEAWGVGLARRTKEDIRSLVKKKRMVTDQFIVTMNEDSAFDDAISYATGDPVRVRKRFRTINTLIERCLQ